MSSATIPQTYTSFRRTTPSTTSPLTIHSSTEPLPSSLTPHQVLVKIHTVSLNFRDVAMLHGRYPVPDVLEGGIPASDCAAEVFAVGSEVTDFVVGDRVAVIFSPEVLVGDGRPEERNIALGGELEGVLREWGVWEEEVLVKLPGGLSWEECSTLACAGVTAWNALGMSKGFKPGTSVYLQGTGGVSMFALLLALAADLKPIISSSSDAKLEAIKKLSPGRIQGHNYRTNPDQVSAIKELTGGQGVGIVVNNTGPASIPADIQSLRARGGNIAMVGFLEGIGADWNPAMLLALLGKNASITGISVGSRLDFIALNRFLEEKKISLQPLIDKVFDFKDSKEAFDYLYSGKHVGKVLIRV